MQNIYEYTDYVGIIKWKIEINAGTRRYKTRLAEAAQCQLSFLSQVLSGRIHLTPDHGIGLCEFWGLSKFERDHFITLIHLARASTPTLKEFYQKNLEENRARREKLNERFQADTFANDQAKMTIYYSDWLNTAVHVLATIPTYDTVEKVASYFSISTEQALSIMMKLQSIGFLQNSKGKWKCTNNYIHLARESALFPIYHQQWRFQSMQSLEKDKNAFNYTSLYTLSKDDQIVLKNMIIDFIENTRNIVKKSNEEKLMCFSLDFFEVK